MGESNKIEQELVSLLRENKVQMATFSEKLSKLNERIDRAEWETKIRNQRQNIQQLNQRIEFLKGILRDKGISFEDAGEP